MDVWKSIPFHFCWHTSTSEVKLRGTYSLVLSICVHPGLLFIGGNGERF